MGEISNREYCYRNCNLRNVQSKLPNDSLRNALAIFLQYKSNCT